MIIPNNHLKNMVLFSMTVNRKQKLSSLNIYFYLIYQIYVIYIYRIHLSNLYSLPMKKKTLIFDSFLVLQLSSFIFIPLRQCVHILHFRGVIFQKLPTKSYHVVRSRCLSALLNRSRAAMLYQITDKPQNNECIPTLNSQYPVSASYSKVIQLEHTCICMFFIFALFILSLLAWQEPVCWNSPLYNTQIVGFFFSPPTCFPNRNS